MAERLTASIRSVQAIGMADSLNFIVSNKLAAKIRGMDNNAKDTLVDHNNNTTPGISGERYHKGTRIISTFSGILV